MVFGGGENTLKRSYRQWLEYLKQNPLPLHIGLIPDGNGRWAIMRKLPRPLGHRAGVETLKKIVKAGLDLGIGCLSVYAFSTENWQRSPDETGALFALLREYLDSGLADLVSLGVRVRVIGRRSELSRGLRDAIARSESASRGGRSMDLVIAFNYGGRTEILDAARRIGRRVRNGDLDPDGIDESVFEGALYTVGLRDPDVIIRTSGEKRVSNFLIWQAAYSEFVSSSVLWPDFTPDEFFVCVEEYQRRERRFGKTNESGRSD